MKKNTIWLIILLLSAYTSLNAQDDGEVFIEEEPKLYLCAHGGFPITVSNTVLKKQFKSMFNAEFNLNYAPSKTIFFGAFYQYDALIVNNNNVNGISLLTNDPSYTLDPDKRIRTSQNIHSIGLLIGYQKIIADNFVFQASLKAGFSFVGYKNVILNTSSKRDYNFVSPVLGPNVSFHYFFDKHISTSFNLGYIYLASNKYNPNTIGLSKGVSPFNDADLKGKQQFITISIGFNYRIK